MAQAEQPAAVAGPVRAGLSMNVERITKYVMAASSYYPEFHSSNSLSLYSEVFIFLSKIAFCRVI